MRGPVQAGSIPSSGITGPAARDRAPARAHALPPDITSAEYWSGASAVATAWLVLLVYAVSQGLG